jgi:hypothetical protein
MTTINDILFGGAAAARRQLGERLKAANLLSNDLKPSAYVGDALASLFDMPIGNVLIGAWHDNRLVQEACNRTRAQPGTRQDVYLLTSEVTCTHHPQIDLDTAGCRMTLLTLELKLDLTINSLVVDVTGGHVVAVGPGTADVRASLRVGRTVLAERHVDKVKIGHAIRLHGSPAPGTATQPGELGATTKPRRHRQGRPHRRRRPGSRP